MFIDMHVHADFFEPACPDTDTAAFRRGSLQMLKTSVKPMESIFLLMKAAGLDKCCLLGRDYRISDDGQIALPNESVKAICEAWPDKFVGFASIDPNAPDCLETLEKAFGDYKLAGLKLHPSRQRFYPAEEKMYPIYELCVKFDRPIIFHSGMSFEQNCLTEYSRPELFERVAASYPKLRICLAHFGWPWVRETAMLMVKYRNVYADTALLYFDSAREFLLQTLTKDIPWTWIDRSLRHQVMFGSNYPRFEQRRLAIALDTLGFRDSTLELIKGKNALEFLGTGGGN